MALLLWVQFPGGFSGIAVVGAEPVAFGAGGATRDLEPPPGEGARTTPLLVMEGGQERGARMWQGVLQPWRDAGVPIRAPGRAGSRARVVARAPGRARGLPGLD